MLTKSFEDFYFGNVLMQTEHKPSVNAGSIVEGSTIYMNLVNNSMDKGSRSIGFSDLEDTTFSVSMDRREGNAITQAQLAQSVIRQGPNHMQQVSLAFNDNPRSGAQLTNMTYRNLSVPILFDRHLFLGDIPQSRVQETLKFKTAITEAWDGTEQRMRLRAYPRSEVHTSYIGDQEGVLESQVHAMGLGAQYALVPMFHRSEVVFNSTFNGTDGYTVTIVGGALPEGLENLPAGSPIAFLSAATNEVRVGILVSKSTSTNLVFRSHSPTLTVPVAGDTIYPVELCRADESGSVKVHPSLAAEVEMTWTADRAVVSDSAVADVSTEFSAFSAEVCDFDTARPVVRETTLPGSSIKYRSDSGVVTFDRGIGRTRVHNRRAVPVLSFTKEVDISWDHAAVNAFRKFIAWTWGRQRSFYMSSDGDELDIVDITGDVMTAQGVNGVGERLPIQDGIVGLDILKTDGTREQYRMDTVVYSTTDDGTLELTMDRAPGYPSGDIASASLLYHVRLSSDSVKLDYHDRDSVSASLPLVTVKQ